ncbi:MAG: DNA repair photolyase [Granulosicoccus sp.]|jgi:DNA repair photolyase
MQESRIKGRGAQNDLPNRFAKEHREPFFEDVYEADVDNPVRTKFFEVYPKTIINKVPNSDVPMDFSINPYQGCEHGCSYCYARPTHEYWGYGPGLDFETNILVKKNAPDLLRTAFEKKQWQSSGIMLSGNTDCYQPIERRMGITRSLLKVFAEYRNPVSIITKNSLVLRDIDLLIDLNRDNLVHVVVSLNTLNDSTRQLLEPRASAVTQRLKTIRELSNAGIPVSVLVAPIIPGLTDHEIIPLVETLAGNGAREVSHIIARLNGPVEPIFTEWLERSMPNKKDKILNAIADCHGGTVSDHRSHVRMKGEGKRALAIRDTMTLAKQKYLSGQKMPAFNLGAFKRPPKGQLGLF